jgi:general secretion pathway protein M
MEQIQQLKQWFYSLPSKEQMMVSGIGIVIIITLFYLIIWEPLHLGFQEEKQKQQSQKEILLWMQQAASEVKSLRASGSQTTIRSNNKPITLVIEQTIKNAGLKPSVKKIESSGNKGARVSLNDASFNQILVWLDTLSKHNGIQVVSANIERSDKPGRANARLTFERP